MIKKMIFYIIVVLIFVAGTEIVWNNYEQKQQISMEKASEESYKKHYEILKEYTKKMNEDKETTYKEVCELLENENDSLYIGTYKNIISYYYIIGDNYEMHRKIVQESIELYKKSEFADLLILETYSYMVSNAISMNKYDDALKYLYEAMEKMGNINYKYIDSGIIENFKVVIKCNFINVFVNNGLANKAEKYYEEIKKYEKGNPIYDKNDKIIVFSKLIYNEAIGNKEELLDLTFEYHEIAKRYNSPHLEGLRVNIAKTLVINDRLDEALEHLMASRKFYEERQYEVGLSSVYNVYGDYYYAEKNYESALEHYILSYNVYKKEEDAYMSQKELIRKISLTKEMGNLEYDLSEYIKDYMNIDKKISGDDGNASLFIAMEEINESMYESKLLLRDQENKVLKKSSDEKKSLITLLAGSFILLLIGTVYLNEEIKKKKKYEKKLEAIVNKDFLTGCYSRSYGINKIDKLIKDKKDFSIALIDIDYFKRINDTYGHLVGDEGLKFLGGLLIEDFNNIGNVIRYGGEEFLIILEEKDNDSSFELLNNFRDKLLTKEFGDGLTLTISGGIKQWNGESINDLIHKADTLLYSAKESGRNRIVK